MLSSGDEAVPEVPEPAVPEVKPADALFELESDSDSLSAPVAPVPVVERDSETDGDDGYLSKTDSVTGERDWAKYGRGPRFTVFPPPVVCRGGKGKTITKFFKRQRRHSAPV